MTVLQAAGNTMMGSTGGMRGPPNMASATLGVRSLREDYCKPSSRSEIPRNLKAIEEELRAGNFGQIASDERQEFPRFSYLFEGGELLGPAVFMQALELGNFEQINGQQLQFDPEILVLRDNLVVAYKPLVAKVRQLQAREVSELPDAMLRKFAKAWYAWESAWLRNREVHAVEALQPLAKAILSLEPLLNSAEKEKLLPWPRVQHQKAVTLKCLEGFISSFAELAACVLPSMKREMDHDPRLLLLMDHILSLQGQKPVKSVLDGLSAAPDVTFPEHQQPGPQSGGNQSQTLTKAAPGAVSLDQYAFKLLGSSVGDAVASGRLTAISGNGQAGRAKLVQDPGLSTTAASLADHQHLLVPGPKDGNLAQKGVVHAAELLAAFESLKDVLLSLKSTLEHIDPSLDRDEAFVAILQRFERAFKRAKRLFLEPDNLA
eukprot:CAMPEP_0197658218 /NCGR_PEP_ID=MMETSP1338-20131121/45107_1 /TAXON_ID=43686 ORGANISM="Pelagodinium beii, Strain RCC1491" /NCGR_SAMPLE_ID=MMETSP1338 /ASSEMBLY_ACC=CAM_ASM_000754 /LENGTH=432 /DNA_ID=CAMNT_0043234767 /DNA_START=54 /DNA_END=1352 /DNA_ORIENTATION=+